MAPIAAPNDEDAALAAQRYERQTKGIRDAGDAETDVGVSECNRTRNIGMTGDGISIARHGLSCNAGAPKLRVEQRSSSRTDRTVRKPDTAAPKIACSAQFFGIATADDPAFLYHRELVDVDCLAARPLDEALNLLV